MDDKITPHIGKYVIENLTTGMYDDSMCIFREYVQNSADAIDKAVQIGQVAKKDGFIDIKIKPANKFISIEDNGVGLPAHRFISILQNIAQSEKELGKEKGFRGIGRLGGLAYCDKLVFESSYKGEPSVLKMVWDAKKMRQIVSDKSQKEEAAWVIKEVTQVSFSSAPPDKHYFKIEMHNVSNEDLLDSTRVKEYLQMVAPLPFDSHFIFRTKIYETLKADGVSLDEYNVFVEEEQIYKGYTTQLFQEINNERRKKIGEIKDVAIFKDHTKDGDLLFWGWHSISDVQNIRLTKINKSRGLRLRKHNIQIGNEDRLENLFKDSRFNYYVVGEVYTFHPDLIPNGRRDAFEDSAILSALFAKLKPELNKIQRLSTDASKIKNAQEDIDALKEFSEKANNQELNKKEDIDNLKTQLEQKKKKAAEAEKALKKFSETIANTRDPALERIYRDAVSTQNPSIEEIVLPDFSTAISYRTDKLSKLNKHERKMLSIVFDIITKVIGGDVAEKLILKIEAEFK